MNLDSILKITLAVAFLLPGFLVFKLKSLVKEYIVEDNFSLTIYSLFFSLLIFSIWLISNVFWEVLFFKDYHFILNFKKAIIAGNLEILLHPKVCISISSYVVIFLIVYYLNFLFHWSSFGYLTITRVIGFKKKTNRLTPWEDLLHLAQGKWVAIETNANKVYVGLIHYISHHPFDRQIIITGTSSDTIHIYENKTEIIHSHPPKYVYLMGSSITAISVIDTGYRRKLDILKIESWIRRFPKLRRIYFFLIPIKKSIFKKMYLILPVLSIVLAYFAIKISLYIPTMFFNQNFRFNTLIVDSAYFIMILLFSLLLVKLIENYKDTLLTIE
ncbi:hypothetical protein LEP1GSC107_2716 [Leptospira interrogans serovar Grippotyphosa str. UI 12769]|uniref:Uncharacterized protein n=3 Tax=Leptospira interrogans TaxID=173 RepID=A0AAP9WAX7_LEPIR|nr:hypothetical protein [Leptospira interrogans]EMF70754.1 hypothetical protein LEP1GSC148_4530 [Leptospira interrogans serovar Canicola str. LT1962]EKO85149.1 hypothetical protein LEP1GSC009_1366 [Leptospira interrogans serovar Grippotyphosa str. Andaman]EKP85139.1 hypothetical protein LEP1GSC020_4117 [Leptospira interrogans serovar Grippotyphosa str. 2006006986]EKR56026.1 hypothetical protein LEP1GSC105_4605 [Leptospira interrogans str. UI 12758]EMM92778.1 hypothetical protein LEP1GSC145_033